MKTAIYIRVSTLDQAKEGYSLAAQEKTLRKWCKAHNHELCAIYADEGLSGKDIKGRPALKQLLADAKNEQIELIVVWALSRFTRSVSDLYSTLGELDRQGIRLISLTESFDTTAAMGRAMIGICVIFSQLERELISERVSLAMQERAYQGKRTSHDVLGYDLDGKDSLSINQEEAKIVRYIYRKYLEHRSLSAVAELCTIKGYTGKRKRTFRAESIKKILTRPIYIGLNSYKGVYYKGIHPPLISPQEFNRVQNLLNRTKINISQYQKHQEKTA